MLTNARQSFYLNYETSKTNGDSFAF